MELAPMVITTEYLRRMWGQKGNTMNINDVKLEVIPDKEQCCTVVKATLVRRDTPERSQ